MDADIVERIHELLYGKLARQKELGNWRAEIDINEVKGEEWGEHLSYREVREHIETALRDPRWHRIGVTRVPHGGEIREYRYTDPEGAPRARQYGG